MKPRREFSHTLLMILVCLVPLFILFVLGLSGIAISPLFFLLFLLICCVAMFYFMGGAPGHNEQVEEEELQEDETPQYLTLAYQGADVLKSRTPYRVGKNLVVEGKLLVDPDTAYKTLDQRFKNTAVTPLLQEDNSGKSILVLVPKELQRTEEKARFPWLNLVLLVLTLITTTWAGAAHQGANLLENPAQFGVGVPYALALMLILGTHELGHYFAARAHNMKVTLPHFIPVPFALGTFGAFIRMKSPAENRRALFDVGVAGPLAGLVIAIPALLIGLQYSTIVPAEAAANMMRGGASVGSSALFALLVKLAIGGAIAEGHQLILHPSLSPVGSGFW